MLERCTSRVAASAVLVDTALTFSSSPVLWGTPKDQDGFGVSVRRIESESELNERGRFHKVLCTVAVRPAAQLP